MQSQELDYLPLDFSPDEERSESPRHVSWSPKSESPPRHVSSSPHVSSSLKSESSPRHVSSSLKPESPRHCSRRRDSIRIPTIEDAERDRSKRIAPPEPSCSKRIATRESGKRAPYHQQYTHRVRTAVFAKCYKGYTLTDGKTSLCHDFVDQIQKTLLTDLEFMGVGRVVTPDVKTKEWLGRELPNLPSYAMVMGRSTFCTTCRESVCHRSNAVECARIVFGLDSMDVIPHEKN